MHNPGCNGTGASHADKEHNVCSGTARKASIRRRWGVILAGGDGTRLQPLTRLTCGDSRPKQFCPLLGGQTLLAHTRQRISGMIDADRVLFVLTKKHESFYKQELQDVPQMQKIVQPHNQGTLPAILWSVLHLYRTDADALIAFFPSDHYFANEEAFTSTIERIFGFVDEERDSVILLGAGAERPETEYGWIEPDKTAESGLDHAFPPVRRFWEKPPIDVARELLRRGCLWNTFVMIGSAGAFLEMIRKTAPVLFETFVAALPSSGLESEEQQMQFVYDGLDSSDFSRQVLAVSTERLLVASCGAVGWSDLGEPRRFIAALTKNGDENPWETADACNKCGLTREQMVTLSGREKAETSLDESVTLVSSS